MENASVSINYPDAILLHAKLVGEKIIASALTATIVAANKKLRVSDFT